MHVAQKDKNDFVKGCIDYKVEGVRRRGRPKKTWSDVVKKTVRPDNHTEDTTDCSIWQKLIKDTG